MVATKKRYVARLHQDDMDRIGGDDGSKMSRFVESDIELERLEKTCMRAHRKYLLAHTTGPAVAEARAYNAAYDRYATRRTELEADWASKGPMSSIYKSAVHSYQCQDRVIGYHVEDGCTMADRPLASILGSDRSEAQHLAAELFAMNPMHLVMVPILESTRNRARRLQSAV